MGCISRIRNSTDANLCTWCLMRREHPTKNEYEQMVSEILEAYPALKRGLNLVQASVRLETLVIIRHVFLLFLDFEGFDRDLTKNLLLGDVDN